MKKNVIFTVIAQNYLSFGISLGVSLRKSNPEIDFILYFADGISPETKSILASYDLKSGNALELDPVDTVLDMAFYYGVTEYCTAIKPFIIQRLMVQGYHSVTYLDPDIYVYGSLTTNVLNLLSDHSIIITPHICSPIHDSAIPDETIHLKTGTYNLGFISVKNDSIGQSFTAWWIAKCQEFCFDDVSSSLFVDQKWINLVPGMFENVYISRHLGLNMAYWNLHERVMVNNKVNDKYELVFFHFSGFVHKDIHCISKYQNRFTLTQRPDLIPYFEEYQKQLELISKTIPHRQPYQFLYYKTGQSISLLARRFYFWNRNTLENPFKSLEAELRFLEILKANAIREEKINSGISEPNKINSYARILNRFLRIIQRMVGPNRYASLCRYFAYVSSLNNNRFLMLNESNIDVVDIDRQHLTR